MMDAAAYFITVSAQSKPICDRCPHPIVQVGFHVFGLILYKRADPQAQIVAGTMATGLAGSKRLGVLALAR